jgi:high-affinity iron transporter
MARNLFSVPIFFIVFRETLEAAIIVAVLLGLVEQIVHDDSGVLAGAGSTTLGPNNAGTGPGNDVDKDVDEKKGATTPSADVPTLNTSNRTNSNIDEPDQKHLAEVDAHINRKRLIRKLRIQVSRSSERTFMTCHFIGTLHSCLRRASLIQFRMLNRHFRQIFSGAALGFLLALAIGAAFIAVWFTQAADLWQKSEELWEGKHLS